MWPLEAFVEDEGDTDIDAIGRFDSSAGAQRRIVGAAWDVSIPAEHWPAARAAAVQGPVAFEAYMRTAPFMVDAARNMYAGLPPEWKEKVRQGALGLAP